MDHPSPPLTLPESFGDTANIRRVLASPGQNRASSICQIQANSDLEAVQAWLREYASVSTTYHAYQKEIKRLLLWCGMIAKKPLSALTRDDFDAYRQFLQNPEPRHVWCGPKSKDPAAWKPFVGPLSLSAQATSLSIINSLMTYLVDADYLLKNPLALIRKKVAFHPEQTQKIKSLERKLEQDEIHALLESIEEMPEATSREAFEKQRLRFIFYLLSLTGLRANELVSHSWQAFRMVQGKWWVFILGKGNKPRFIPVNDELLQVIKAYRQFLGKAPYPLSTDHGPLIISKIARGTEAEKSIGTRQIHHLIKALGEKASEKFPTQKDKQQKLKNLSPHWFRHLFATLQDQAAISRTHIRDNLGHETLLERYIHSGDIERHEALQKIKLSSSPI